MESYIAHIRNDETIQTVEEHSKNVAAYCRTILAQIGMGQTGELIGLLHDAGKLQTKFTKYILDAHAGKAVRKGSVIHTSTGMITLMEKYHHIDEDYALVTEMLSYAIGAHHGLFDSMDLQEESGFKTKCSKNKSEIEYETSMEYLFQNIASKEKINKLVDDAVHEYKVMEPQLKGMRYALLTRLLLSALIDADRQDTMEFMMNIDHNHTAWNQTQRQQYWQENLAFAEEKMGALKKDTIICKVRQNLSDTCKEHAQWIPGIYLLDLPTGAGKTLTSLRYAYAHAMHYGKERVIFLTPLLSVLEQNAREIRDYTCHKQDIVEHHSNVIHQNTSTDELDQMELAMENWHSRVIISTFVQFLNVLFDGKTSSIRRMQALCNSVIVIDEIQSLPWKLTAMFNQAINFLTQVCHATVILCSATQPGLDELDKKYRIQLGEHKRLVELTPEEQRIFKRTEIRDCTRESGYSIDEIVDWVEKMMQNVSSALIICNTKKTARALYKAVKKLGYRTVHLSTSMCMAHRRDCVDQIKTSLHSADEKVVCVSTQLVEAGVDFSFQYVIRLIAGLDNIIQSAGRCNRHGECAGTAYVDIMNIQDEDTSRLKEIQMRQNVMRAFLDEYARDKHSYQDDLASDISIYRYYKRMYKELENKKTILYPINLQGIQCYLYKLLGRMGGEEQILCQPFKTVGDAFEVFDDHGIDILVPYGDEGKRLIADFFSERAKHDILYVKGLLETSKNYTIHVFEHEYRKLCDMEMVQKISYGTSEIVCLKEAYYDEEGIGLDMEGQFEFMNM